MDLRADWNPDRLDTTVKWSPADLDRCEHGRHSIDHCFDCPGGVSSGNHFLLSGVPGVNGYPGREHVHGAGGVIQVRIGTMVHGEPIWVVAHGGTR